MKTNQDTSDKARRQTADKGDWVQIHRVLLSPDERSSKIPQDTKKVPLELWMNGFLRQDKASVGDEVEIITAIGRYEHGILLKVNPGYNHSFGNTMPELIQIGRQLRSIMREAE